MATLTDAEVAQVRNLINEFTANLTYRVDGLDKRVGDFDVVQWTTDLNTMWLLVTGILVFFMQAGFSLLEAGAVREKNVNNILYKNLMDAAIGVCIFWLVGFGFGFGGSDDSPFIGTSNFGLWREGNGWGGNAAFNEETQAWENLEHGYAMFFFQWAFAATSATIVSGAVAERTRVQAYFMYTTVLSGFIYPVVVHWVWDSEGWLSAFNDHGLFAGECDPDDFYSCDNGMIDFAGSGVVHMVGGFSALVGAIMIGPRKGRFVENDGGGYTMVDFPGHSSLLSSLGVAILWLGWYGFNCGSTLVIIGGSQQAAKVAATTTLSASAAAITVTIVRKVMTGYFDLLGSLNGVLAGLVGVTAGCATVDAWGALCIGCGAGLVYMGSSALLQRFQIDDPLDAFAVHGACGVWGVLCAGVFSTTDNIAFAYGKRNHAYESGRQFAVQLVGVLAIATWTTILAFLMFFVIQKLLGDLRVSETDEDTGLDIADHHQEAYHRDSRFGVNVTQQSDVQMGELHAMDMDDDE